jgi:hypothetical protein
MLSVRRRWKIVTILAVTALLLAPFVLHFQAKWRLAAYRAQLIKEGEKLEFNELTPLTINNGFANGAKLLKANTAIGDKLHELSPYTMRFVAPGKARVEWRELVIIQEVNGKLVPEVGTTWVKTNVVPLFEAAFSGNEDKLKQLRETTAEPLQFPINYSQGIAALLPHLASVKTSAQNLTAATSANLRTGKIDEAQKYLLAQVNLILNWEHEPTLISQLVRTACASIACGATWECLQAGKMTDAQLRELQEAFARIDLLPDAAQAIRFERATANQIVAETRKDNTRWLGARSKSRLAEFSDMFGSALSEPKEGLRQMLDRYPRYWAWCWVGSFYDECNALKFGTAIARNLEEAKQGRWKNATDDHHSEDGIMIDADPPWISSVISSWTDTLQRGAAKFVRQQSEISLVITAIALEKYRLKHGKLPHSLSELSLEILKTVPLDYEDGKPVRYSLRPDGSYLLYSVGDDGHDDGGDATSTQLDGRAGLFYGKDIVWPQAATPEEVRAFNEKEGKKK